MTVHIAFILLLAIPLSSLCQDWRPFLRKRVQIVYEFEEITSHSHENFEEQYKVFESSIIINFCIFINAY